MRRCELLKLVYYGDAYHLELTIVSGLVRYQLMREKISIHL